jgi:hypothetical protein
VKISRMDGRKRSEIELDTFSGLCGSSALLSTKKVDFTNA